MTQLHPAADHPAADAEGVGDLLGRSPLIEPHRRLDAASLLGGGEVADEVFQLKAPSERDYQRCHRTNQKNGDALRRLIVSVQKHVVYCLSIQPFLAAYLAVRDRYQG
jgi:hypothetical protein